jgi:hypothetical protein
MRTKLDASPEGLVLKRPVTLIDVAEVVQTLRGRGGERHLKQVLTN